MKKKNTRKGKSYWNNEGAYQNAFDNLSEELIPASGEAETVHGKMLRAINRLYYDFCNNGNGNVFEESWGEWSINPFYEEMIDELDLHMDDRDAFEKLEQFIKCDHGAKDPDFTNDQMAIYDKVVDGVMYQIITEREDALQETTP
tara:strand:- start:390 stop:824 length:435 start_codon:yes stop_codon:yes gene_type:complete